MNPLERLKATLRYERTDRIPVIPELAGVTARLKGKRVRDYVTSGETLAECQIAAREFFQHDAVFAFADLCVEAEALGCELAFPEENYPYVKRPIIRSVADLGKVSIPDPRKEGRMPEILKAVAILKEKYRHRVPVVAHALAPLTIASRIMDVEKMLYMIVDEPDHFKKVLSFTLEVSLSFIKHLLMAGADSIIMFNPSASPAVLPPKIFREFELPNLKKIFSFIKEYDAEIVTWYSVAGAVQEIIKDMEQVKLDVMTIDYLVPLDVAFQLSPSLCFNGNIKPLSFVNETPDGIFTHATSLLKASAERGRFILGSGCEIPLNANLDAICAMVRAAREFPEYFTVYGNKEEAARCVSFFPSQKKVYVKEGTGLVEAAAGAGIHIPLLCNKAGVCGSCAVQVEKGYPEEYTKRESAIFTPEQQEKNCRLACKVIVASDMEVFIPRESRIRNEYKAYRKDFFLESADDKGARYVLDSTINSPEVFGVAVDIGTTTIAMYVHNLATGDLAASGSILNPQIHFGDNIMARAHRYLSGLAGRTELRNSLLMGINSLLSKISQDTRINYNHLYKMVVVGNSVMHHIFLNLDLEGLVKSPFTPVISNSYAFSNRDKSDGLKFTMNENATIVCPPLLNGFVGSDAVAGILAAGIHLSEKPVLYVDLGTNGEIVLGNREKILATSVAAGPAFERFSFTAGKIAAPGVIYRVDIGEDFHAVYKTLEGGKPSGLCGSAIVDTIASFLRLGIIDKRGRFVDNPRCNSLRDGKYVLVPRQDTAFFQPLVITARDIEDVQKAKGGIMAGIAILMKEYGIASDGIDKVILTGGFGMNIDVDNAVRIGLIPAVPKNKVAFISNAAGVGARLYLLYKQAVEELDEIMKKIRHINVANDPEFNNVFIDSMLFQ